MFDFAWSEIALIGVVALVLIGPKDLPVAIKAVTEVIKKARRMAGEFQTHVDELVRDADLQEVRDQFNDIRRMGIKNQILRAVDEDGSIRNSLSDPMTDISRPPPVVPVHDSTSAVAEAQGAGPAAPPSVPAFVPPSYVTPTSAAPPAAPAFVPPPAAPANSEHA